MFKEIDKGVKAIEKDVETIEKDIDKVTTEIEETGKKINEFLIIPEDSEEKPLTLQKILHRIIGTTLPELEATLRQLRNRIHQGLRATIPLEKPNDSANGEGTENNLKEEEGDNSWDNLFE